MFPRVHLTMRKHWFREWFGTEEGKTHYLNQWWPSKVTQSDTHIYIYAVRQQAITWANDDPDLWHHMASLGHNELMLEVKPSILTQWLSLATLRLIPLQRLTKRLWCHNMHDSVSKHQGIHQDSRHKWPVMQKMFPFDDVIMCYLSHVQNASMNTSHNLLRWYNVTAFHASV